jgi:hypothetical protein
MGCFGLTDCLIEGAIFLVTKQSQSSGTAQILVCVCVCVCVCVVYMI